MRGELEALHERAEHGAILGSLLTAAGWTTLLDSLEAPEAAWPAIEAAIGGELEQALVWRDGDLVERLAEARGAARLLATAADDDLVADAADRDRALRAVGGDRTLAEWAGGAGAGLRLLRRTVVAPDLAALLAGWRALPAGWLAVTPRGDLADGRGLVSVRGRADAAGGEAARRHARRRELAEALERAEQEQSEATASAARQLAAVGEASRRLDGARGDVGRAEGELRAAEANLAEVELRHTRAATAVAALDEEVNALPPAPPSGEPPDEKVADARLAALEAAAKAAREVRASLAAEADAAREAWVAAREEARGREERQVGQGRERATHEARRAHIVAEGGARAAALAAIDAEAAAARDAVAAARAADEAAAAESSGAEEARQAARADLLDLERGAGGSLARLGELERDAQTSAIEASRHEEALAALARERELALDSLPVPEAGEAPADPGDAEAGTAAREGINALDDEALDGELRRVRRTLAQIGSVNPFAVEEHRELSARLDELAGQETDLSEAIGSTEELIGTLDAQISEQFNAAFAAIGEKFDEFCRLLFAGGSASLSLGGGTDGDAPDGIEIVVRPPGKRLQRLAMLSGGERALTGVALLFAMLSVNPVPFCILDEVDAALDEANIGRFADALRKLSEAIDFVVITHNRATIEVADTIYGVTMTDAAVSRIVSLRLADIPVEASA
jgi:chromosome segregation protein